MSKHRFDHTVDHTLDRKVGSKFIDGSPEGLQRIEVITGVGGRRRWPAEAKARIVVESFEPGAVVSEVARRHGLSPQQVFGWRHQARGMVADANAVRDVPALPKSEAAFAPVIVDSVIDSAAAEPTAPSQSERPVAAIADAASIEIALGGAVVRVRGAVDVKALAAVLKVLKVAS